MNNSGAKSYGMWERGIVDDRNIISRLLALMDSMLPNGYEITDIKIVRRPPYDDGPSDYDRQGFTAIKVHYDAKQ